MKKVNYRSIIMAVLMVASLSSYIYLTSVKFSNKADIGIEFKIDDAKEKEAEIYMPDVELVKKIFSIGKAVMHPFSK